MQKHLIVLTGKSSSGKDAIQKELMTKYGYSSLVSTTTRPMRSNEKEGVDYFFTSNYDFGNKVADNGFVEFRGYFPANGELWYYGLSKEALLNAINSNNDKFVVVLELNGLERLKEYVKENKLDIEVISYYIYCPEKVRKERAMARDKNFNEDEWNRRVKADNNDFDYFRVNTNVNATLENVKSIEDITDEVVKYTTGRLAFLDL